MPIYEYECTVCKRRFERFQSFSEAPVTACPDCGGPVRKVLQPVGIVFKGSGWYKTDSRVAASNGKADSAKEPATETAAAKAGGDAKGDGAKADGAAKPEASAKPESASKPAAGSSAPT